MKQILIAFLFFFAFSFVAEAQTTRYVKVGGVGNGTSWTNASGDLQAIIDASTDEDTIWVAKGVYKPTKSPWPTTTDGTPVTARDNAFVLKRGVKIFGGFAGNETLFEERNFTQNETVLSGDLNDDNMASDGDTYHVVISLNNSDDSELNGFTIRHGYANGSKSMGTSSATTSTSLSQSNGGAICTRGSNTGTLFKNLIIIDNYAKSSGGAVYQRTGGAAKEYRWENVKFLNNVSGASGGGLYFYPSINTPSIVLEACVFENNTATTSGGGFYHNGAVSGTVTFNNGLAKNNTVGASGGAIYITQSSTNDRTIIKNSIFDSNKSTGTSSSYGGHIYANRNLEVDSSSFTNGANVQGGALYISSSGALFAFNSVFENNKSTSTSATLSAGGGGAVYLGANTTKKGLIQQCTFISNTSANLGGAIHFQTNSTSVHSSSFSKNTALLGGGAISVYGSATAGVNFEILNSLFYANEAKGTASTWAGGAVFMRDYSAAKIVNSTFYANQAVNAGGAVYQANNDNFFGGNSGVAKAAIYNSIFYGNIANTYADIRSPGLNSLEVKNSLTQLYGTDGVDENIVGVDPHFASVDESNAGFLRLGTGSRAINVAEIAFLDAVILNDLQGKARVIYDFLDLGCFEYDGPLSGLHAFYVQENAAVGTVVGMPTSNIGGTLSWTILSGNTDDTFKMDSGSGSITVNKNQLLDYEARKAFRLRVRAYNGNTEDIFMVFVILENVMEDPGTPILTNKDANGEVRSYFPRLEGVAEPESTINVYMDGVKTPYTTESNTRGEWNLKFEQSISPGTHSFYVTAENSLGLSNPSGVVSALFILYPGEIVANNILTPNGDGKNDVWIIPYLTTMYPKNEVLVYDKKGKIVFRKQNYQNDWDGSFNGSYLNTGTYYYHINLGTGVKPVKGTLTILNGH